MGGALQIVLGALGVLGIAAAAVAFFLVALRRASADVLRDENNDLRSRLGTLEKERAELNGKVTSQGEQLHALQQAVTGAPAWAAIVDRLDKQVIPPLRFLEQRAAENVP